MRWWLAGGRLLDPAGGLDAPGDLFVDDGHLVDAPGAGRNDGSWRRLDCEGCVVAPAFVDLAACLPDPRTHAASAAAGGFARVLAASDPVADPARLRDREARALGAPCRVSMVGAVTLPGPEAELAPMGLLVAAGAAALSDGGAPIRSSKRLLSVLEYAGRFPVPLLLRASDLELEGDGVLREGALARRLGLPGVPPEAEAVGIFRLARLAERAGAHVHLTHIWSAAGVAQLRQAQSEGLPVTGSTTVHHLALEEEVVATSRYHGNARFSPPLGDPRDQEALREAVLDGTLRAVATDHRPLSPERKDREFERAEPGAVGLEIAFPLALQALGDVSAVVRALAIGPSEVLGLAPPRLAPGRPADVVVLDPALRWKLRPEDLHGTHRNTPLLGRTLRGRVRHLLVDGRLVTRSA